MRGRIDGANLAPSVFTSSPQVSRIQEETNDEEPAQQDGDRSDDIGGCSYQVGRRASQEAPAGISGRTAGRASGELADRVSQSPGRAAPGGGEPGRHSVSDE